MQDAARFPLDFDTIDKGTIIPATVVERVTGVKFGTQEYGLASMALASRIESHLAEQGRHVTVCTEGGAIKVLTDEEAVPYNSRQGAVAFRKLVRSHSRLLRVDVSKLDTAQRADLERSSIVMGKMIQGALAAKKEALRQLSHTRTVPGLLNHAG